jgi:hypothetical protein
MDASPGPSRRLALTRTAGIRPGEGRILGLVALLFMVLETGRGIGEVGVDTLVVSRFGADMLPYLFIGLGVTSLVAALAYGAPGRRPGGCVRPPARRTLRHGCRD